MQAPIVNAGAGRTVADTDGVAGENVTLAGSASDPEGEALTYQWFAGARTPIAAGPAPTVALPDGVNTLTLEVTDEGGVVGSDTVVITVNAASGPVANAGADRTIPDSDRAPGERATLDGGQSTDADGAIASYQWFRQTGAQTEESLGAGATLTVTLPDGANTIRLQVTDNAGLSASDTAVITVGAAPQATDLSELPNLTPNQQKMAVAVDRICGELFDLDAGGGALTQDQQQLLDRCDGLLFNNSTSNQIDALDELVADDFAVARTQTLLFANTQFASVMDRLIALRGGAKGLSLAGLNVIVDGKTMPLAQLQDMAKGLLGGGASADEPGGLLSDKWGLWARGNYSFGDKDANALEPRVRCGAMGAGRRRRLPPVRQGRGRRVALAYGDSRIEFEPAG